MTTRVARCWGGPLDGQIIAEDSPVLLYVEPIDSIAWAWDASPEETLTIREGRYDFVRFWIDAPGNRPDHPGLERHYDFVRNRTAYTAGAWVRPDDRPTRDHITAGLRLIAWRLTC